MKELRINYGPGLRVYFVLIDREIILIIGGGDKGSQERDIEQVKNTETSIRKEMPSKYREFTDFLDDRLKDPEFAAQFLSEALENEDFSTFLLSLKDVIRVHGSIKAFAEKSQISRSTLHNLFSGESNPELRTILHVLHSLGYDLKVTRRTAA